MYKIITGAALIILVFITVPCISGAQDNITLNDLIEKGREFDGKTLSVQGEAIGEVLERGKFAWVNINDRTSALGIWMTIQDAGKIALFGDYKHIGDIVYASGTFNRACSFHGGDMDIHADVVKIIQRGNYVKKEISVIKIIAGTVLTLITALVAGVYLLIIKRRKERENG